MLPAVPSRKPPVFARLLHNALLEQAGRFAEQ